MNWHWLGCAWSNWSDPVKDNRGYLWQSRRCSVCNRVEYEECQL